MTNEQQALAEMPIWLVIVLALVGGVSGEMWRADKDGARGWALMRRLALRSGACIVCGVSAMMLMIAAGMFWHKRTQRAADALSDGPSPDAPVQARNE